MAIIKDFIAGRTPPQLYEEYLTPGFFTPWTNALIEQAPPGNTVLDLACGTGGVTRALAQQHPEATIQALDVAPPMLDLAKALTDQAGLSDRITYVLGSADALPFETDSMDSLYCQQGFQFFPDKPKALSEMKRVLKPGGQIALAVWTSAQEGNPVFGPFEDIIAEELGADLVPFGPFAYGDMDTLRSVVEAAGLNIVSLDKQEQMVRLPKPRTLVLFDLLFLGRPAEDGSLQPIFDPADDSNDTMIEGLIERFESVVAEYVQTDGTLYCPSTANVLVATG